ncbi:type II secretion system F family protein [Amedibacillus sp. YH-ame6]
MKKFNNEEAFEFCMQMSMILSSGLSVQEGLEIIMDDSDNKLMKEACKQIHEEVVAQGSFYQAIKDHECFDDYMKQMVKIGEVSGHLDNVMQELSAYYERAYDLSKQLREALFYPFVLLLMMWVVVGIIMWKVLPIFTNVLENMGSPLPESATMMMQFGSGFAIVSFVILTVLLLLVLYVVVRMRKGEGNGAIFLSKFFLTKRLFHNISMARMTYAFSLFISGGFDIEDSLSYLPGIVDEELTKEKIIACMQGMKEGESFEAMIQKVHLYDGAYANMIITGFHSGKSDDVMKKISLLYEKDVDHSISSFLNTIEPVIVVFLSLIVGVILLSVMLPLMSIMTSLG